MSTKKWNILYVEDTRSQFNTDTKAFDTYFNHVDKVSNRESALDLFEKNSYDIVINDLSIDPEEVAFMKQLQDIKKEQSLFVLVDEKDTDKVYGMADMGIHAFIISPEQFEAALEAIGNFDPYEQQ